MSIDLSPLLERAFFSDELQNASVTISQALSVYERESAISARPFEVVAAAIPDEAWVREGLVHPLVYFCESEGATFPKCANVVVMLFVGRTLYAIPAEAVIQWGGEVLGSTIEHLHEQYGTHELDAGVR